MSNKLLTVVLRVMEVIIQSITFISIAAMLMLAAVGVPESELWKCFLVVIPVTIAYAIRRYVRKFGLFYFLNAILLASSLLLGSNDSEYFFYFLIFLLIVAYSIRLKLIAVHKSDISELPLSMTGGTKEEAEEQKRNLQADEQMSVYFVVSMVVGYFMGQFTDKIALCNIQVVLFVFFVLLQVIYNNLKKLNTVYIRNSGKAEFPAAQIKRVNTFIIVVLVVLMFLGMMIFYHGEYGNIFTMIGAGALALLRGILKILIVILGIGGRHSQNLPQEQTTKAAEDTLEAAEQIGTSPIAQALSVAFTVIILCVLVAGVTYALIRYIKHFNQSRKESADLVEYVKPVRTIRFRQRKSKNHITDSKADENVRLRKVYRKRVLKGAGKNGPDRTQTPVEITQSTITEQKEIAEQITCLYEKARYSDQKVTKEEIENMKNLY